MIRHRWRTAFKKAASEEEALEIVRLYLEEWTLEELAAIPQDVRPSPIRSAKDVTDCTFRLAHEHAQFTGDAQALALLQEMLLFFTHASMRITQLRPGRDDRGSGAGPGALDAAGLDAAPRSVAPSDKVVEN